MALFATHFLLPLLTAVRRSTAEALSGERTEKMKSEIDF